MTVDIPIKDPVKTARTGGTIDIKGADALPDSVLEEGSGSVSMMPVFNRREAALYMMVRVSGSNETNYVLKGVDPFANNWELVEEVEPPNATGSLGYPFVTARGTLLYTLSDGGSGDVYRAEGPTWDDHELVSTDFRVLSMKHAQDSEGNIYAGRYDFGAGEVYESTDDGQTWTQIADLNLDSNHHIHHVVPHSYSDLLVVSVGDDGNSGLWTMDKDGSNIQENNALGSDAMPDYRPGVLLPLSQGTGGEGSMNVLVTSDYSSLGLIKANVGHGSVNINYCLDRWMVGSGSGYSSDAVFVDGGIAVNTDVGRILYTRDGWTWGEIEINNPKHDWSTFSTAMAESPQHVYVAREKLTIIPKNVFEAIEPDSATYTALDGSQGSSASGVDIVRQFPARLVREWEIAGNTTEDVEFNRWASIDGQWLGSETVFTDADEIETGTIDYNGRLDVVVDSVDEGDRWNITLRK